MPRFHQGEAAHTSFILIIAGVVLALDAAVKRVVIATMTQGQTISIIPRLFSLEYVQNPGAAYGIFSGQRWPLVIIGLGVTAGLAWYSRRVESRAERAALGIIMGGALGNVVDRLLWGSVTDMLRIDPLTTLFQVFNVADVAITLGALLLLWTARKHPRPDHRFLP